MKMFITLEPHDIFGSKFACLYIYFLKLTGEITKKRTKVLVTPGFEPMCVRLLD